MDRDAQPSADRLRPDEVLQRRANVQGRDVGAACGDGRAWIRTRDRGVMSPLL